MHRASVSNKRPTSRHTETRRFSFDQRREEEGKKRKKSYDIVKLVGNNYTKKVAAT